MFARGAAAGDHDGDACLGNVHTLVQNLAGDQNRVFPCTETLQHLLALDGFGVVRDDGQQESLPDEIRGMIVRRKDENALSTVLQQQFPNLLDFGLVA